MIDVMLMQALMKAIPATAALLIVGARADVKSRIIKKKRSKYFAANRREK
jgi:hypothetical protein